MVTIKTLPIYGGFVIMSLGHFNLGDNHAV